MALIASLVVGTNNATTVGGNSSELSTPPDRARFLALHRSAGAIIIGKRSADNENYSKTSVPIYVLSRNPEKLTFKSPHMQQVTVGADLSEVVRQIEKDIEGEIVIEAGPQLLIALIEAGVVGELQLSITPIEGDGNFLNVGEMMSNFFIEDDQKIEGTRLLQCRYNGNATNS